MLSCVLQDVHGNRITAPRLLSLRVNIDEGVPADSLYAVFPYTETEELAAITLYDGDTTVFIGVIDEEEHERSAQGEYLKVSARSLAAHLLDNEAMPCAYDHPSMRFIYERYVQPYGITLCADDDAVYFGEQSILKGSSCYRVLKKFCTACYSSVPRISSVGVLYPKGMQREQTTVFGSGGVRYTALSEINKRCEEISTVYVKTSNMVSYTLPIENARAKERGIRRVRYLNAALTESPMHCADAMIHNGDAKAYTVRLRCPTCLLGTEGNRARLQDTVIDGNNDLYISALHYRMNAEGEYTDVILKRRTS